MEKNTQQAILGLKAQDESIASEDIEQIKKDKKKCMKEGVAMAKDYLKTCLGLDVSIIDVEVYLNPQDIIATDGCVASCLLDAGCAKIVTDGNSLDALDAAKIPRERLMAHFHLSLPEKGLEEVQNLCSSISVEVIKTTSTEDMRNIIYRGSKECEMVVAMTAKNHQLVTGIAKVLCKEGNEGAGSVCLIDPTAVQLGYSYAMCLRTDREDLLYTTVVCTRNGEALGLVYSSPESITASLQSGRGVYYSRSRNSLWRKGDTSGHWQKLHRLDIDCDGDALRVTVTQMGEEKPAFCHLNTLGCWGESRGLRHLEETLQARLKNAPAGSYTKRLFDDTELLRDKLVEEAQELAEADTKEHVAEELADVLYFAMVRAVKAGVSIDDAVAELDARARKVTRRKGDSKAFRIAAGNAILGKKE